MLQSFAVEEALKFIVSVLHGGDTEWDGKALDRLILFAQKYS